MNEDYRPEGIAALLSEEALGEIWNTPEEDEAWKELDKIQQPKMKELWDNKDDEFWNSQQVIVTLLSINYL